VDHRAQWLADPLHLLALLRRPVLVAKQKVARRRVRLLLARVRLLLLQRTPLTRRGQT
jgi:hypothetical protein